MRDSTVVSETIILWKRKIRGKLVGIVFDIDNRPGCGFIGFGFTWVFTWQGDTYGIWILSFGLKLIILRPQFSDLLGE